MVTLNGDLEVTGSITESGGACCTSDMRAKRDVSAISMRESLRIINSLQPIRYKFKPWFEEHAKIEPNTTFDGISAQELDAVLPQAIRKREITDGDGNVIPDFHGHVMKAELTPHLINSVKYLEMVAGNTDRRVVDATHNVKALAGHLEAQLDESNRKLRQVLARMNTLEEKLLKAETDKQAAVEAEAKVITDRFMLTYVTRWDAMEASLKRAEDLARSAQADLEARRREIDHAELVRRVHAQ